MNSNTPDNDLAFLMDFPVLLQEDQNFPTARSFLNFFLNSINCDISEIQEILRQLDKDENKEIFQNNMFAIATTHNYFLLEVLFGRNLLFYKFEEKVLSIFNHPASVWLLDVFELGFINASYQALRFFTSPKWQGCIKKILNSVGAFKDLEFHHDFSINSSGELFDVINAKFLKFEHFVKSQPCILYYLEMFARYSGKFLLAEGVREKLEPFLAVYQQKFMLLPVIPTLNKVVNLSQDNYKEVITFLENLTSIKMNSKIKSTLSQCFTHLIELVINKDKVAGYKRFLDYLISGQSKPQQLEMLIKSIDQAWPHLLSNQEISNTHVNALEKLSARNLNEQAKIIEILKARCKNLTDQLSITTKQIDLIIASQKTGSDQGEYESLLDIYQKCLSEVQTLEKMSINKRTLPSDTKPECEDEAVKYEEKKSRFQ